MRKTRKEILEAELEEIKENEDLKTMKHGEKKAFEEWKNRPSLPIIGKAYTNSHRVRPHLLASVNVSGNGGTNYIFDIPSTQSMQTYFHNEWGNKIENEFREEVNELTKNFMEKLVKEASITCGMMSIEHMGYDRFPKRKRKLVEKEILKEQAKVLSKFKYEELKVLLDASFSGIYSTRPIEDFLKGVDKGLYKDFVGQKFVNNI